VLRLRQPVEKRPDQRRRRVALGRLGTAVGLVVTGGVADLDQPELLVLGDGHFVLGVQVLVAGPEDLPDLLGFLRGTPFGGLGTLPRDHCPIDEHAFPLPFLCPCRWTPPRRLRHHRGAGRYPQPKIPNRIFAEK
jgi:hypothetical protein